MSVIVNGTQMVPTFNGTLIDPDTCTVATCSLEFAQLTYIPTFAGNLAYLAILGVVLLAHIVLGLSYRTWGFVVGMICGLILEIVGYAGRVLLHHNVFEFNYFVIYLVCLTIAPAFLSASIYLCLSRLVIVYGTNIARFSPKVYTLTFVTCDFISLILQAAGGAISAIEDGPGQQSGINTMIAGLAFQVFSLFVFMVLGTDLAISVARSGQGAMNPYFSSLRKCTLFRLFPLAIATSTVLIFVRCCFRVAELKNGFNGSLANNETMFMIFEGPMIIIAVLVLVIFHPGRCFGGAYGWAEANWTWKRASDKSGDYQGVTQELKPAAVRTGISHV